MYVCVHIHTFITFVIIVIKSLTKAILGKEELGEDSCRGIMVAFIEMGASGTGQTRKQSERNSLGLRQSETHDPVHTLC